MGSGTQGWGLLYDQNKVIKKVYGFPPNTQWFDAKNKQAV